jgi:NAD(P)-dependent dehydrogenase (short-subunit alcohol dehydrogenase family)
MQTADLGDLASLPAVFAASPAVDILVNNAGMQGPIGPFEAQVPSASREALAVNFLAAAECCRLVIPGMKERRRGKIVNISGGRATGPRADFSAYAAAKAALVGFKSRFAKPDGLLGIALAAGLFVCSPWPPPDERSLDFYVRLHGHRGKFAPLGGEPGDDGTRAGAA